LNCVSIVGIGSAIPEKVLTNFDLEKMVDTSDEWIRTRTGIKERRMAEKDQASSDYGAAAARKALQAARLDAGEVELLVVATVTPDKLVPSTACIIQQKLQAYRAVPFDINAGCSGFVYALSIAHQFLQSGTYKNALVVGVDLLSRITDWKDRSSCILFGDAAGAAVLETGRERGRILNFYMGGDGSKADLMHVPAGGSFQPANRSTVDSRSHFIKMNGNEIFRFAVKVIGDTTLHLLQDQGLELADIDWLIPHQANWRIIDAACKWLQLPREKAISNIEWVGNTSSASIPVAMDDALNQGKIKDGDLLALIAFGAGMTWGGCLVRW